MSAKACRGCGQSLPIEDFYVHLKMVGGRLNFCKRCVRERMRQQRLSDPTLQERERKRGERRGFDQTRMAKYRPAFAMRAHSAVRRAILSGALTRPSKCSECGASDKVIEAAHEDYARPLDVRWLCHRCHSRWDQQQPKVAAYAVAPF